MTHTYPTVMHRGHPRYNIHRINIELTTRCNFDCDYCYTKHLPDADITMDQFRAIVDEWAAYPNILEFNLTGEGEALLHPQVWDFVDYIKTTTRHKVTFITNGSALTEANRQLISQKLDRISVSVDTMDVDLAERVGRHRLDRVIANVRELAKICNNITIMTVDYGQNLEPVKQFAKELNVAYHCIKPLNNKVDYANTYTLFHHKKTAYPPQSIFKCLGLPAGLVAYNLSGAKMPCCFIKDMTAYPGYDELLAIFNNPTNPVLPKCCVGCNFIHVSRPRA